ncbi:Multidrug resistance protein stp [Streptomyces sp. YIM 121038]|uniref:MFS transporter n=1 Tax=Streptomyces sp. YIM 121038 TaxID=2136401 RepID=UPI0011626960|nr:MFS transporter [Streptomyces sp. YIM 121038]QCX73804.1 Multidrug resistance protein stp [Streptomyces sp. YIM 121038]QCX82015.1 Multidrug resistance protein stp [Streptomyces sp. YIM 121038]
MADTDVSAPTPTPAPAAAVGRRVPARAGARRRGWLLAVVLGGTFMAIMDGFIVNVAVPAVRTDLGASFAQAQLTVSGYLLAYGLFLVAGGRLGDRYGFRRLFLTGLAVFTAASLACGLAGSAPALIAFRTVQALGAALFYPQVLSVLQTAFAGARRARAFAAFGAAIGGASVAGQLLGGLLVQADLFGMSWRPVFLLNVPLGLLLLLGAALTLPPAPRRAAPARRGAGLDAGGTLLLSAVLALLLVPLTLGQGAHWPPWSVAMLAAFPPAAALLAAYERALARRGGQAVIDPGLFTRGRFRAGSALAVAFFAGNAGLFFLLTWHLQSTMGYGALRAGLCFTPLALAFVLASLLAPRLQERIGTRLLAAGYALNAAGTLALLAAAVAGRPETAVLLGCLAVIGFGQGLGVSPLFAAALREVPAPLAGAASGVLETAAQLGMALGVTLTGLAFTAQAGPDSPTASTASGASGAFGAGLAVAALLALAALALLPRLLRTPAPAGALPGPRP